MARRHVRLSLAKERPTWDRMIVHLSSREMLESVTANLPPRFGDLRGDRWTRDGGRALSGNPVADHLIAATC
jgi:hypothetical protein